MRSHTTLRRPPFRRKRSLPYFLRRRTSPDSSVTSHWSISFRIYMLYSNLCEFDGSRSPSQLTYSVECSFLSMEDCVYRFRGMRLSTYHTVRQSPLSFIWRISKNVPMCSAFSESRQETLSLSSYWIYLIYWGTFFAWSSIRY